jgi:hypothetical protein
VKIEERKSKRYEDELGSRGEGRGKKNKDMIFLDKDTRTN